MTQAFSKRNKAIGAMALLAAAAAGYYLFYIRVSDTEPTPQKETGSAHPSAGVVVETEGGGNYTIEQVPVGEERGPDFPALRRPLIFSSVFSEEARQIMRQKIGASVAALEKDPRLFDEWMNLAILRKTVDDYEGARQIWEFLTLTNPAQQGPFANLAALYAFDLKDAERAEKNFTIALNLWKKEVSVWRNAYDFYRHVRKDDARAKEILRQGITETQSPDLQYLMDHYSEL